MKVPIIKEAAAVPRLTTGLRRMASGSKGSAAVRSRATKRTEATAAPMTRSTMGAELQG